MKHNQIIYSRFEYSIGSTPHDKIFEEYENMFENEYENGVIVNGASVAINLDKRTAIVMTYSKEADNFLRLKFCGRKDVKMNVITYLKEKQ